ncbi:hypothetical protein DERP_011717 [Dermatophagoides pteronyssinus]|uniref:Uncharacterized protein n=1 Tax=Dermatophagoides pteronyssinus TaxID=6956 RepID=A0ABQ8J399_DERPT|nr:hypothetical protein DERP_011717 [Dermatophagoides pteronyssinus]
MARRKKFNNGKTIIIQNEQKSLSPKICNNKAKSVSNQTFLATFNNNNDSKTIKKLPPKNNDAKNLNINQQMESEQRSKMKRIISITIIIIIDWIETKSIIYRKIQNGNEIQLPMIANNLHNSLSTVPVKNFQQPNDKKSLSSLSSSRH